MKNTKLRTNQIEISREVVVARKGTKGFVKTTTINQHTTICDTRLARISSLFGVIVSLTGQGGLGKMPAVFCSANYQRGRDKHIPKMYTIFKYAETQSWTSDSVRGDVYEGILVDNKNNRYSVKASADGSIAVIRQIRRAVTATPKPVKRHRVTPIVPMWAPTRKPATGTGGSLLRRSVAIGY